ncbi:glycosyltransferase family 69 protein [Lepidopterella palustris CBS 459.81]|uniref:Glycosyltransferase family 69 protein n=1 Tax=Lepidopterella palustris CBS 459.81 TaxID=1314670 RepID=A0A8E2E2U6_9PEZI|nr:glycosyltransferase family 69 protein [Lepidopterella palustris CBS 459.81]
MSLEPLYRSSSETDVESIILNIVLTFVLVSFLNGILRPSYLNPPARYGELEKRIVDSERDGRGNPGNEKVFIAANILNEELVRGSWGSNLQVLVEILGRENVFVSIYENDGGDGPRDALLELREKLPCNASVVAGDHIALTNFPSLTLPGGQQRTKRITYLAEVRNRALLPLHSGPAVDAWASEHPTFTRATTTFDRVLFLNDVFYNPTEAAQLLFATNSARTGKAEYSAACAIDFVAKFLHYDSFVVRDMEGYGTGLGFYPWFSTSGSSASRNDVLAQKDAVRVRSCWGGMAAFDASIFQPRIAAQNVTVPALKFRSTPEPFWESAECCLLFADMEMRRATLQEPLAGVFVNPFIRVAYSQVTWDWLPFWRRYERIWQFLQYWVSKIGFPEFNPRRTHAAGAVVEEKVWVPNEQDGQGSYKVLNRVADAGGFCGQRRMFVMKRHLETANADGWGKNWENVKVPRGG